MLNFEKAVLIANFYDIHKDNKMFVKSYLQQTLSSVDAFLVLRDMKAELNAMQDMQDMFAYEKALEQDARAQPKKVEIIINKHAVKDALDITHERITEKPELIQDLLAVMSVTAYKYQLKYACVILNEMIHDSEVWEDVTFH